MNTHIRTALVDTVKAAPAIIGAVALIVIGIRAGIIPAVAIEATRAWR